MEYYRNPNSAQKANNQLVKEIDQAVKTTRAQTEWRHEYMTLEMYGYERQEQGREEGRLLGIIENIATQIYKKLNKQKTIAEIADNLDMEIANVEFYVSVIEKYQSIDNMEQICKEILNRVE